MNDRQAVDSEQLHHDEGSGVLIEEVASGQKLLIGAIVVNLASYLLISVNHYLGLLGLVGVVMAIVGFIKMASGLKKSTFLIVLMSIAMFIPLINLLVLVRQNGQATKVLKSAGYKVGLLGASK